MYCAAGSLSLGSVCYPLWLTVIVYCTLPFGQHKEAYIKSRTGCNNELDQPVGSLSES